MFLSVLWRLPDSLSDRSDGFAASAVLIFESYHEERHENRYWPYDSKAMLAIWAHPDSLDTASQASSGTVIMTTAKNQADERPDLLQFVVVLTRPL